MLEDDLLDGYLAVPVWNAALVELTEILAEAAGDRPVVPTTLGDLQVRFGQHRQAEADLLRRLSQAHQGVLDGLIARGQVPAVTVSAQGAFGALPEATIEPVRDLAPRIVLGVNGIGQAVPLVPHVGPDTWNGRTATDVGMHVFALCHEAAHVVHAQMARPFVSVRLSSSVVEDLNAFLLGPLAPIKGFFRKVYSELFADVYGTMLMATVGGEAPWVAEQVANVVAVRAHNREHDADPSLMERREIVVSLPHLTDRAVAQAWAQRTQWQDLDGPGQAAWAQALVSEAWLDLVLPGRPMGPDRTPLDERLVRVAGRDLEEALDLGTAAPLVGHWAVEASSSRLVQWRTAYPTHPVLDLALQAHEKLQAGQPEGAIPYANQPVERRASLATDFIYRDMLQRGHAVRALLVKRGTALTEGLLAAPPAVAVAPEPAARRRGLRR